MRGPAELEGRMQPVLHADPIVELGDGERKVRSPTGGGGEWKSQAPGADAADAGSVLEPKVFVPHLQKRGATPRRVAVERKKKLFAAQDIGQLLVASGYDAERQAQEIGGLDAGKGLLMTHLPLEAFDNTEYETYEPEEWLRRGRGGKGPEAGPSSIPARAFYRGDRGAAADASSKQGSPPTPSSSSASAAGAAAAGKWKRCTVTGIEGNGLWRARWADTGEVSLLSRTDVCFDAEDPFVFAQRVGAAHRARIDAEAVIRFNLYVDSMPTDEVGKLDSEQVNRVLALALSTNALKMNEFDTSQLLNEVNMDYARSINRIVFEAGLADPAQAEIFEFLKLPAGIVSAYGSGGGGGGGDGGGTGGTGSGGAPAMGVVDTPEHDFSEQFSSFAFHTFLIRPEVVHVLGQAQQECDKVLDRRMFNTTAKRSLKLDEFQSMQSTETRKLAKFLKEDWTAAITAVVRSGLQSVGKGHFDILESRNDVYQFSKLKKLLRRTNFLMQDTLRICTRRSLEEYTAFIEASCAPQVAVNALSDIAVTFPLTRNVLGPDRFGTLRGHPDGPAAAAARAAALDGLPDDEVARLNALAGLQRPPPLFAVDLVVSAEPICLNQLEVDTRAAEIDAWRPPPDDKDLKCDLKPIAPIIGHHFVYNVGPEEFRGAALEAFGKALASVTDIEQVERVLMKKLFWSHKPVVACVRPEDPRDPQGPWVPALKARIDTAIGKSLVPCAAFVKLFDPYIEFLNLAVEEVISALEPGHQDGDGGDDHDDGAVDLKKVRAVVEHHLKEAKAIEAAIPSAPIDVGLFSVSVSGIRTLLLDKHRSIVTQALAVLCRGVKKTADKLVEHFGRIDRELKKVPKDVEEVATLSEYMSGVTGLVDNVADDMQVMFTHCDVLDEFRYEAKEETMMRWRVFGWPKRIADQMLLAQDVVDELKLKYSEEMAEEQVHYAQSLNSLEDEVASFANYTDLKRVDTAAAHCRQVQEKLAKAEEDAKTFNSREALFEQDITSYSQIPSLKKKFEPFYNLWMTASNWLRDSKAWVADSFLTLDGNEIENSVDKYTKTVNKALKTFDKLDLGKCGDVAKIIKTEVEDFAPNVPFIMGMRQPGMADRHWDEISESIGIDLHPDASFTLQKAFDLNLRDYGELIGKVGDKAAKEYQLEKMLNSMEEEWVTIDLQIMPYRDTGTFVLKGIDELIAVLDEQITKTQGMMFSAYKAPFEERIESWNTKLQIVSDLLEEWIQVQRAWLYLEPIFASDDIIKQLPTESKRFMTVDKNWRNTLAAASRNPNAIKFCANEKLLQQFKESNKFLDLVSKGLSDYLETKRGGFARFYFLSNDELLSILSETKDVNAVQPHLKKCFEGVVRVKFEEGNIISSMISREKEKVEFFEPVDPNNKGVEFWMTEIEDMMRISVRHVMYQSIKDYWVTKRGKWMQKWPGMCVLNGSQYHWTKEMEELINEHGFHGVELSLERQLEQLKEMVVLVRGKLEKNARTSIGALTVIDVHARDVTKNMVAQKVDNTNAFIWLQQLRYYWIGGDGSGAPDDENLDSKERTDIDTEGDLFAQMVGSRRPYGYEYLGNSFRLVITPLTDKCYLTLMGALQMILGGAPAGPAGTGKTETTKDLAKALAKQCVVFNCGDGLDYLAMGKFFKGLAACGAWACFDEFNRINIEVLSVVAQQIITLQTGVKHGLDRIDFEGSNIKLDGAFAVFITMNPGYAGRTELPENLAALFRPVAMMVPDYALIGEIMLFAYGFEVAKEAGAKMVSTFKLCSEQLSSQFHYDYGMRAVKTVITAAGNLKRAEPDAPELQLLLRALQDVNLPKFLAQDLPLFDGIMSDLFPGISRPEIDYGALMKSLKLCTEANGLQPVEFFLRKNIQLFETIVVRHGLMVVGPTGAGKSSNIRVLSDALTLLQKNGIDQHPLYEKVRHFTMNPKSITMGQLYGEFDPNTREFIDGVLPCLYRNASEDTTPDRKFVVFDGPVDAIWIENMNTVLDDNKKLCLNSGEMLQMSATMTMMFEVDDLSQASPATVSRCGMVYMEPASLGIDPLIRSWLATLPAAVTPATKVSLWRLFDTFMEPAMAIVRRFCKEVVPTVNGNLCQSCCRIIDTFLVPLQIKEGAEPPSAQLIKSIEANMDSIFSFSLVWSVGGSVDGTGRRRMDGFLRDEMRSAGLSTPFPDDGLVYDYAWDVEGAQWRTWMETEPGYQHDPKTEFAELVIPTKDSIRNTFLLNALLMNKSHVLMVGETGTGKTVNINRYLQKVMDPKRYIPLTLAFSAQTSANQTQDIIDAKLEKRKKGVYGPAAGFQFIIYVDDLNMPQREKYFAQPPIELLRQCISQGGWYDRKTLTFRRIIDRTFVSSMGPPGGGRNPITARMKRWFNIIGYVEMDRESKKLIFETILGNFLATMEDDAIGALTTPMVASTIDIYENISHQLLPTPAKSHYTFNLRDLAKVFQGVLMCDPKRTSTTTEVTRLWVHESRRVFEDRLINMEDVGWFEDQLKAQLSVSFQQDWKTVVPADRLFFGDYMVPGADPRIYEEVDDHGKLVAMIEEYLVDYNAETKTPMNLVMFLDAIEHVSRISRILRQPQGNALCLGVGGSGRQSLTRLAGFMADYEVFQIEVAKGYGMAEWREDVKTCLLKAGLQDMPMVFLFSDTQIVTEQQVEDINNILNSGDLPKLYSGEEIDQIMTTCRVDCQRKKITPTKINIFAQYILRVRRNLHVVFCMSPLGEAYRTRLIKFPSLVSCCTIDWFMPWPEEALINVAANKLNDGDYKLGEHQEAVVTTFKEIHQTVEKQSEEFYERFLRRNYVTPTSYLELLSAYVKLLVQKRKEVGTMRERLSIGVEKISSTKVQVKTMQDQLTALQPVLKTKEVEVGEMMVQITADKAAAAETKTKVEAEESSAQEKAAATKAIADDAQRDLDEALPALDEAVKCLSSLKKADIDEVKNLQKPPNGVILTAEAVCIMFKVKPNKVKNPNDSMGKKVDDYFTPAKQVLFKDAKKFMSMMIDYDKDNIPDSVIQKIEHYIVMPEFTPKEVEKASVACTAICMWVRAMHKYHHVARAVEPKKKQLAVAQAQLDETLSALADAKGRLKAVMDRLATLEKNFNEAVDTKERLADEVEQCKTRLDSAMKLINGLGGEEVRWTESVGKLAIAFTNLDGDVLVSAGAISYVGAFTGEFRRDMFRRWTDALRSKGIPHTPGCSLVKTMADPVKVRSWNIYGLPTDEVSTENGIIIDTSRRWPLCIDPQGQANRYLKNTGKEMAENGMDTVRLSDKNMLRSLENGVRLGRWILLENIAESLDAALEPVLQQQVFKQGGQDYIKLGDKQVYYDASFKFFLTTKMPNPHYPPEICVKVTLLNFAITPTGLEDQLLGELIKTELPEVEEKKNMLVVNNARMKKELNDIENKILHLLSNSKGNILDDTEIIETLDQSKKTSLEINEKMAEAAITEKEIDQTRETMRPIAFRASTLFFCINDMFNIDPMYQYSLPWFVTLFTLCIKESEQAEEAAKRIEILNEYFTYKLYDVVSRSLFEKHKLLFSFLLTIKILQSRDLIDPSEWRFLISGQALGSVELDNPDTSWIETRPWMEICSVSDLAKFDGFAADFAANTAEWKEYFDSAEPHRMKLPGKWDAELNMLQKMCVLRCLRPDMMSPAIQDYVSEYLGGKFIVPPPFDLPLSFATSDTTTPLVFVLSVGTDPMKALQTFADQKKMRKKFHSISLGQGQGVHAARMIENGAENGEWVFLQNCHLCISWMPELETIVEGFDPNSIHPNFRLWLSSMPSQHFPVSILQNGVKMTNEPPKGLRANLYNTYYKLDDEQLDLTSKKHEYKKLLFGLAFFHAIIIERKKFGPLGWNIQYAFNETDFDICRSQLAMYLDQYEEVPYSVLNMLTANINYGGRVTDDKDLRTIDVILLTYYHENTQKDDYKFSKSGLYVSPSYTSDEGGPHASYMAYINQLPINPDPEAFDMHSNANITCAQNE
eukprot:g2409.t1